MKKAIVENLEPYQIYTREELEVRRIKFAELNFVELNLVV